MILAITVCLWLFVLFVVVVLWYRIVCLLRFTGWQSFVTWTFLASSVVPKSHSSVKNCTRKGVAFFPVFSWFVSLSLFCFFFFFLFYKRQFCQKVVFVSHSFCLFVCLFCLFKWCLDLSHPLPHADLSLSEYILMLPCLESCALSCSTGSACTQK